MMKNITFVAPDPYSNITFVAPSPLQYENVFTSRDNTGEHTKDQRTSAVNKKFPFGLKQTNKRISEFENVNILIKGEKVLPKVQLDPLDFQGLACPALS